jgi:hypothetical protein
MGARPPLRGYNHNIRYQNRIYHVQTEDSGLENPHVFTHLFLGGMIISSARTDYAHLTAVPEQESAVRRMMQSQHKTLMKQLKRGEFDERIVQLVGSLVPNEPQRNASEVEISGQAPDARTGALLGREDETRGLIAGANAGEFVASNERPFHELDDTDETQALPPLVGPPIEADTDKILSGVTWPGEPLGDDGASTQELAYVDTAECSADGPLAPTPTAPSNATSETVLASGIGPAAEVPPYLHHVAQPVDVSVRQTEALADSVSSPTIAQVIDAEQPLAGSAFNELIVPLLGDESRDNVVREFDEMHTEPMVSDHFAPPIRSRDTIPSEPVIELRRRGGQVAPTSLPSPSGSASAAEPDLADDDLVLRLDSNEARASQGDVAGVIDADAAASSEQVSEFDAPSPTSYSVVRPPTNRPSREHPFAKPASSRSGTERRPRRAPRPDSGTSYPAAGQARRSQEHSVADSKADTTELTDQPAANGAEQRPRHDAHPFGSTPQRYTAPSSQRSQASSRTNPTTPKTLPSKPVVPDRPATNAAAKSTEVIVAEHQRTARKPSNAYSIVARPDRRSPAPAAVVTARPAIIVNKPGESGAPSPPRARKSERQRRPPTLPPEALQASAARKRAEDSPNLFGSDLVSERSLDEVILGYLAEDGGAAPGGEEEEE